jgi:predicted Zn finger-like uncharacterized protein
MTTPIVCPKCQTTYQVADAQLGRKVLCKKCQTVFLADLPTAEVEEPAKKPTTPSRIKPKPERDDDEEITERRRPERRAAASRRRDEDDEDDDRPRRSIVKKRKASSGAGMLLIVGGVVGSFLLLVGLGLLALFLITREPKSEPNRPAIALQQNPGFQRNVQPDDNPPENHQEKKVDQAKEDDGKDADPPPPPPRQLLFETPLPLEATLARPAQSKTELDPEVVQRVKGAAVYLRVTLTNGGVGQGSGFFGMEPNLILTNAHVVGMLQPDNPAPKSIVAVRNKGTKDEKKFDAVLIGLDRENDLAMLRVSGPDIPPPLRVKSANDLYETQRVWAAGFPLGEAAGSEITLSDTAVSALRRKDGVLTRVQVNGGITHGNSGGPIVDAAGDVIGVSVSIIYGTQLNFAVPGDAVQRFVRGRIIHATLGYPVVKNDKTHLPVTFYLLDPLKHIKSPAVDVWVGPASATPRPPSLEKPAVVAGDSAHETQALTLRSLEARADLVLPATAAGKVIWVQPRWLGADGKPQWATAQPLDLATPAQLEPALLQVKHQIGTQHLVLDTWNIRRDTNPQGGEHHVVSNMEARLVEITEAIDKDEHANVRLNYRSYSLNYKDNNQTVPESKEMAQARRDLRHVVATHQVDKDGTLLDFEVDLKHVPNRGGPTAVPALHEGVQNVLQSSALNLPNKQVKPGETWKGFRPLPGIAASQLQMTYTYVGTRQHNGRAEAVVTFAGKAPASKETTAAGQVTGTAILEIETGQVLQEDAVFDYHFERTFAAQEVTFKTREYMQVRLRREPPTSEKS